jgi:hypothetical protein
LKGAILDWITPRGQYLNPPLARNVKTDRGFHHERTGALLCPAGLDWSNTELVLMLSIGRYADILQDQGETTEWRTGGIWRPVAYLRLPRL